MATVAEVALEPDLEIIDLTGDSEVSEDGEAQYEEDVDDNELADEVSRAQLRAAIHGLPEARLRHVVAGLVDTVPAVYRALAREILEVNPLARVVVPRWETCANCGETYDVHAEEEERCIFHPGRLEADEAKILDWDEDCHGPMDSAHNRDEYPENFSWTCCDTDGLAEGCVIAKHSVPTAKKRRL